ncbi:hypothetical protein NPIL_239721 [Nephila pilipes]|uniref:Uncharacterized protein n=1 Tax=Nephila pilipes TaxID=299642 RepID=A0A8X6TI11_NEPPI|nr:hypothetical protein NPIL_239721 [Nephila pilipes]
MEKDALKTKEYEWKIEQNMLKTEKDIFKTERNMIKTERDGLLTENARLRRDLRSLAQMISDVITRFLTWVSNHELPMERTAVFLLMFPKTFLKITGFESTLERNGSKDA